MAKKRILIVDDSKTALLMTTVALNKGSYEILTAGDGAEGLAKALAEKPDLIVLDVVMPKMDGHEVCKRVRESADAKATPIIMLTTLGEKGQVAAGFESGCTEYMTKPINMGELLAAVKRLLAE